jgi:sugar O-acyltransferase (sialic acid O-acetyltransferase NeuD family)
MTRLFILGAESLGREAAEIAAASGWNEIEFLDDAPGLKGSHVMERPVAGGFTDAARLVGEKASFFIAVGAAAVRARWMEAIRAAGGRLVTLVHPGACISPSATIGPNTMVSFGCHFGANVAVGEGCVFWSSVVVSHDCTVGAHCFFGPAVASGGYTHIGDRSMFGCGARLRSCITIGSGVVIGIGAVATRPVPDDHFWAAGTDPVPIRGMTAEDIYFGRVRTLPRSAD